MDTKGLVRALGEESLLRHVSGPLLLLISDVVTKVCVSVCVCKHTYIVFFNPSGSIYKRGGPQAL